MNEEIDRDKPIFPMSAMANGLQVHQRILRIYYREKILVPQKTPKDEVLYSINDLEKGKFIKYLAKELKFDLTGIKIILQLLKKLKIPSGEHKEFIEKLVNTSR